MEPERATLSSELRLASDVQPHHSETQEQHVAIQQHGAIRATATATPAESAEASQSAQQPHQAAHDAATPPEADDAAQQPELDSAAPVPDAVVIVTSDSNASPDAPPPEQQQPTAEAAHRSSGHIDIPAAPQQQLAANSKRPAAAQPSPPSPARTCSLSDAELPPRRATEAGHAAQPQQHPATAAAEQPPQSEGREPEDRGQEQHQDVQADAQGGEQGRQGSHDGVGAEQPQQPEGELAQQQAQPASSAAPAHRRNTPYICQVDGCGRNLAKEKEYYRRYRVCKSHAGAQEVVLGGDAKRYCQQCSVFHPLGDFDGDKRSCRARLSWHNNKRRKKVVTEGEAPAAAASSGAPAPRVTRATLATKEKPADDDSTPRSSGRVAARRVSSDNTDGDADGLQWGAVRGRRGGANPAASARAGQMPPSASVLPWGNGMGPADAAQQRLAAAAAAGAAAAAAAAPPLLLGSQYAQQLQASSSLLAAAQAYAAGQRSAVDPAALAAHMGLPTSQVPPSWSALAALQSLDSSADAALRQAQMQHLAQLQASQAAAEAATAREVAAAQAQAQAAAQAAAVTKLRDMPQQQRMQDPRAATSLINVVRAAFERQQQQQQQQQGITNAAAAHIAEDRDTDHASSSAFQPYRPTAVRAGPGSDGTAADGGYASKPLMIAGPRAAFGANSSPPKDGSADWKARLLQRFHSAHADAADEV